MKNYVIDNGGKKIEITNMKAALKQADEFRQYQSYGESPQQLYWHDVYLKLLLTLYPRWNIFHFRLLSFTSSSAWREIEPIPKILPSKHSAIELAKRIERRFTCVVHLSGFNPMDELKN